MCKEQIVQIYVKPTIVGAGALQNVDAAIDVKLGDPARFVLELWEPSLDAVHALQARIDRLAELVIDVARDFVCGSACRSEA